MNIAEDKLWFTEQKKIKTSKEKEQLEILIDYSSNEVLDTTVLKDIEKLDFIKSEILLRGLMLSMKFSVKESIKWLRFQLVFLFTGIF